MHSGRGGREFEVVVAGAATGGRHTTLTLDRRAPGDLGFSVTDPRYAFDLALIPKVRLNAAVDIGVYEKTVSSACTPSSATAAPSRAPTAPSAGA